MNDGNGKGKAVSPAKLAANRKNALKSTGPRTPEGKAKVRFNALKHGLLAREAVILDGDGKEDLGEFTALVEDLVATLAPEGPLEEMLVELIALCYWRKRRACRYETGLVRDNLDDYQARFYGPDLFGNRDHYTEAELTHQIKDRRGQIRFWKDNKAEVLALMRAGKPLDETYPCLQGLLWKCMYLHVARELKAATGEAPPDEPRRLHEALTATLGWSDQRIWRALLAACDDRLAADKAEIAQRERERVTTPLELEVARLTRSLPASDDMDQLLRYETAIERQLYRALAHFERLQRRRRGELLPPPLQVEVHGEK